MIARYAMDREKLEVAIDRLENCTATLVNLTTVSDRTHVASLRELLPEILAGLRAGMGGGGPSGPLTTDH